MRSTFSASAWLVPLALVGCAGPTTTPPPSAPPSSEGDEAFHAALEAARAKRAVVDAASPPPYAGDGSRDASLQYAQGPLSDWVRSAGEQLDAMRRAYAASSSVASSGEMAIDVSIEALDAAEALTGRFVDAGDRSAPTEWKKLTATLGIDFAGEYHRRNELAAMNHWLRPILEGCVERADAQGVQSAAAARCRSSLNHVKAAIASAPKPSTTSLAPPSTSSTPAPPPWVATTQVAPCVFAGSLQPGTSSLTLDEAGKNPIARLDDGSVLRADRVEFANTPTGRVKVVLSYPIVTTAWLDAGARLVMLPERLDVVPGHVWIEAGAAMSVAPVDGTHVKVSRPLESPPVPAPAVGSKDLVRWDEPSVRAPSASASRVVACEGLRLSGSPRPDVPVVNGPRRELLGNAWVALFDDAKGTHQVARLRGPSVFDELAQAQGFAHIASRGLAISVDGWVQSAVAPRPPDDRYGMIGVIRRFGSVPYRPALATPVGVRLSGEPKAQAAFTLSPDAVAYVVASGNEFDEIVVTEFADSSQRYFVAHGALVPAH
jgi:hypothetical protein